MKEKHHKYEDYTVSRIIRSGFIIVIALSALIVMLSISSLISVAGKTKLLKEGPYVDMQTVLVIQEELREYHTSIYKAIASNDYDEMTEIFSEAEAEVTQWMELLYTFSVNNDIEGVSTLTNNIFDALTDLEESKSKIKELAESGETDELYSIVVNEIDPLYEQIDTDAEKIVAAVDEYAAAYVLRTQQVRNGNIVFYIVVLIFALGFSGKLAKYIIKTINDPLKEIENAMVELEAGNFSVDLTYESKNEFGVLADKLRETISQLKIYIDAEARVLNEVANMNMDVEITEEFKGDFKPMKDSINQIIEALNNMIIRTRMASDSIHTASVQVSEISQTLAVSSTEQAASVEELAATVNQITDNVTDNAKSAEIMSENTKETMEKIEAGRIYMDGLSAAMEDISNKSEAIGEIIQAINDIASQTNLLSLNASIEAARAGEVGKGFAVVASEIGKLATQCANAVKDTEHLVNESMESVKNGSEKVAGTLELLKEIVESSEENGHFIEQLAAVCGQQAAALEQTLAGTNAIAESITDNSGVAEEASASSEELQAQAEELKSMMEKCRTK